MATYKNNPDPQPKNVDEAYFDKHIRSLSERQVTWIQSYLTKENASFIHIGSTGRQEELIRQLRRQDNFKDLVDESYLAMSKNLVSERYFGWLTDNLRGQIFVLNVLYLEHNYHSFDRSSSNLMGEIYLFFDNKNSITHVDNKISLLNNMEQRWRIVFEKENYSKWLNEKNIEQIEWTREYLKKDGKYNNLFRDVISPKDIRSMVLVSLDLIDCPDYNEAKNSYINHIPTDRKERIIDKMKKAWSQQKYRDAGKTKKPYHLPLTKGTKHKLEKMSQVQGISETTMLDILINRFYELDYVDVDGKDLY